MGIRNLELTTSEKTLIATWLAYRERHGADPSQRWLARELKVEVNAVRYGIRKLTEKGYMREKQVTEIRLTLNHKAKKAVGG